MWMARVRRRVGRTTRRRFGLARNRPVLSRQHRAGGCDAVEQTRTAQFGTNCRQQLPATQAVVCDGISYTLACRSLPASGAATAVQDCTFGTRSNDTTLMGRDIGDRIYGFSGNDSVSALMGIDSDGAGGAAGRGALVRGRVSRERVPEGRLRSLDSRPSEPADIRKAVQRLSRQPRTRASRP
jgi:hypothetical protein